MQNKALYILSVKDYEIHDFNSINKILTYFALEFPKK